MAEKINLAAAVRNEFGKGAARRARRAGQVPGVVYAKDFENKHVTVDLIELLAIIRNHGTNAIVTLDIEGEEQLTMIKHVDQNVITFDIDHVDFFAIQRGERVEVEVPVVFEGEPAPGTIVYQDADVLNVEADVLAIPEEITVSVEGLELGSRISAADIQMPANVTLAMDPETMVLNIVEPETEDEPVEGEDAEATDAEAPKDEEKSEEE